MRVFRHLPSTTKPSRVTPSCAITIGNFDGYHLGHQALINTLLNLAQAQNLIPTVITFEPHPQTFFLREKSLLRLCTLRNKLTHFSQAGIVHVYVLRFSEQLAGLPAQEFVQTLHQQLNVRIAVLGEDFRFGQGRLGSLADFANSPITLHAVPHVFIDDTRVSSTRVRDALQAGNLALAERLLSKPYNLCGRVVTGQGIARTLGFPTANLKLKYPCPLPYGVYAVTLNGNVAVANWGVRPTVSNTDTPTLEVHILQNQSVQYDTWVQVDFWHKIRPEQRFDSLSALQTQIARDVQATQHFFETRIV